MRPHPFALAALLAAACARPGGAGGPVALQTEDEKTIYALGLSVARSARSLQLSPEEVRVFEKGLEDGLSGASPLVPLSEYGPKVQALAHARESAQAAGERERGRAFLDAAAREPGAVRLPSGLVYRELAAGTGLQPTAQDTVQVHYRGTLPDGTEVDSSYKRGAPATFPLGDVIHCWSEGVQRMKAGGKARLVCPSDLAYGDRGTPGIPPGAALAFDVELLQVTQAAAAAKQ